MSDHPSRRPPDLEPEEEGLLSALAGTAGGGRGCPGPERLQAALAGALPEEDAAAVERHRAGCSACQALGAALAEWDGPELSAHEQERLWRRIREQAPAGAVPPVATARRRWIVPAAAAAALVALVPAYLAIRTGTAPPPGPSPSAAAPSAGPRGPVLAVEKLPLLTPPGAAVVWRGESLEAGLKQALEPYVAGDVAAAVPRLQAVSRRYPDAAAPRLYLGVAHLLLGDAEAAVAVLEAAPRERASFWAEHVEWYLAAAYERAGRDAEAMGLLRGICDRPGPYRGRACAAVPTLGG